MRPQRDILILGSTEDLYLSRLAFILRTHLKGRQVIVIPNCEEVQRLVLQSEPEPAMVIVEAFAISDSQALALLDNAGRTRIVAVCRPWNARADWALAADAIFCPSMLTAELIKIVRGLLVSLPLHQSNRRAAKTA